MSKASEKDLEVLHGALCGYFLKLLNGQIDEMVKEDVTRTDAETGEVTHTSQWVKTGLAVRPSAGEVAVMAKFLKDNAITGAAVDGSSMSELEKALEQRRKARGKLPTTRDVQDAMREIKDGLIQ